MFWTRLLSSIALVVIALATVFYGGYILAAVLFVISLIGYGELLRACKLTGKQTITADGKRDGGKSKGPGGLEVVGYLAITAYYGLMVGFGEGIHLLLILIVVLIAFMFVYVFQFPRYEAGQIMAAFFCFVYAPVMLSCIYLTRNLNDGLNDGIYVVWLIFISSWICDTCAYCVGMLFGKHKLVPVLSPKKSVEGALGGVAGAAIVGAVYGYFMINRLATEQEIKMIPFAFAVIGGLGAVVSQVGDLAASAIKRNYDIKDYGRLIPGHGGIMDRFDSVIFTAPMIYVLAEVLLQL